MDLTSSITHQEQSSLWDWDSVLLLANPVNPDSEGACEQWQDQHEDQHQHQQEQQEEEDQRQQQQQQQRRRRDPRLTCPNFLAGRVPCACSDVEDDDEEERLHKRSKVAPRCQVPNCQSDLVGLKGYHQRHRVCLTCANATSVFLRSQHQRYCQQCGKFHPLPDFDSGKRSCRRKLEKHNNRRRRSLLKEASTLQSNDKDATTANTNNSDGSSDAAQRLPETPPTTNASASAVKDLEQRSTVEEQSLLAAFLLDDQHAHQTHEEQDKHQAVTQHEEQPIEKHPFPTCSSSDARKHPTYTSPCPTRRISFKFYDWNPADFPRRLREQILEWLANMPVELEGYIRSGCTILTLYIAMPEEGWSKLAQDWSGHVARLVRETETGFWDKGCVAALLDDNFAYIEHGLVSSRDLCETNKKHPVIHSAFPLCLEAGKRSRVTVTGHNLLELNSRLLVGSEGKYLPCYVSSGCCSLQATVDLIAPQRFGVAFIEVAHDYGISNFVPLLVADTELHRELSILNYSDFGQRQDVYNLLTDLGWLIRCLQDTATKASATSSQLTRCDAARLHRLSKLAVERGWCTTVERVLQVARAWGAEEHVRIEGMIELAQDPAARKMLQTVLASQAKVSEEESWYTRRSLCARQWKLMSGGTRHKGKYGNIVKAVMGLAVACAGFCIVLLHPTQVLDLSASLRRCLWYKQQN